MNKELLISIAVIVAIIILDIITTNYTEHAIYILSQKIEAIKEDILNERTEKNNLKKQVNQLQEEWTNHYKKLAYYLEHDELEKVKTKITRINGYIEQEEYKDTYVELEETSFILQHIADKEKFSVQSIF